MEKKVPVEVEKIKYVELPVEVIKEVPVVTEVRWSGENNGCGVSPGGAVRAAAGDGELWLEDSLASVVAAEGLAEWTATGFWLWSRRSVGGLVSLPRLA